MMFFFFTGCGIKGNPVMPSRVPDHGQIVQNMEAVSSGNAVILKWDFYDKDPKVTNIAIEKSEVGSAGNECKDCPRTFKRVGQVPVKPANPLSEDGQKKEYSSFSFKDKEVEQGKTYNYRLMLCDDSNVCLKSSAAEINFK
jgi:hypothetical protein